MQNETKEFDNKNNNKQQLENYCNQKLLEISPIHGFSPKPYFLEYNVSNDIRMEILTYLKPIQLFKTMTLLNKQFNRNVRAMHSSTNNKYSKMFETRNFTFNSFFEMEEYCNNMKRKAPAASYDRDVLVDWSCTNGYFFFGPVTNMDSFRRCISARTAISSSIYGTRTGVNIRSGIFYWEAAPYKSITHRPCNKSRFVNTIIKRGYYNETCDINISSFQFWAMNSENLNQASLFDIPSGFTNKRQRFPLMKGKYSF